MAKTKIDLTGFKQTIKSLQKISGKSFQDVLKAEAGHILRTAINYTPKATEKKIVKRLFPQGMTFGKSPGHRVVTNWKDGKKYHVAPPVPGSPSKKNKYSKYALPYKYWLGQANWVDFIGEQMEKIAAAMNQRGLAASQFYFMSVLLNIPLPTQPPKYIKSQKNKKRATQHIKPVIKGSGKGLKIILESRGLEVSKHTRAQNRLMAATASRIKNFQKAVHKDWINEVKYRTRNYPLLFK